MDFHGMKRKELQALCKKHGVPANLTSREMADRLASIFKENEDPVSLEKLSTNPEEIGSENEAKVVKKQLKKVRFSPENQTFKYEVSVHQQPGRRSRKQMLSKNPAQVIENAPNSEDIRKVKGCQVRVTRSRVQDAVEDDINMVSSPPVGRKRGRGGKKNKDVEVTNIGNSEVLELGQREDVKNGRDKVTSGLSGRQLRSRKNVTQEDSKKIRNGKGGDEVHLLDESSEESDVREDVKSKNGPKQSTRNARKEDQSVAFSSEVEKVEVVPRVTRQSRAQSKDVAFMVENEVKIVGAKGGCEEVLQLEQPQIGRVKNALRQNDVPQRMSAESSLLPVGGAEAEKPLRRSKRNSEKDCAKSATSVKSETQVTKVQEQSERDIALVEPSECLRRNSSRRKCVVSQSGEGGNKEEFLKKETRKRSSTTELDAIVEHSSEIERATHAFTSQHQAPLRRSRRKTVILNAAALTDTELANKEDIGKIEQLRAPLLGKGMTEELPRKSSRNSSRYSLSGTSKEDQIAVAKNDQGVNQQTQEPIPEEEKTSVLEHHPVIEKPQRRSNRITSISASVAPPNPTAKGVEKKQQSKSRMAIIEEEAALTEKPQRRSSRISSISASVAPPSPTAKGVEKKQQSKSRMAIIEEEAALAEKPQRRSTRITSVSASVAPPNPTAKGVEKKQQSKSRMAIIEEEAARTESLPVAGELPAGKDELIVSEGAGNKNDLDLNVSKQAVKNADSRSNKRRKGLRRNSGAKKQCGFVEASPLLLDMEECKDSAGNMEETLIATSVKLVSPSTDQEMKQSAHKSVAVYEKESNLVGDDIEKLVHGGNVESEVNCMSSQSVNTTCVFDDANCSDPKRLKFESDGRHVVDSSEITFPAESHGNRVCDQETKEDMKLIDTHSAHESLVVYKEDRTLVESDKERLVQVDTADSEMNHHPSSWSLNDSNWVKSRQVEFESNVINMDSSEITSIAKGLSLADQRDLTGATSTFLHSEKELGTEPPGDENTNLASDNVNADDSRAPFGEAQILVELIDTSVTAAESVNEEVFNLNEFGESSRLKCELENSLKKAEEMIATDFSNREGIPHIESSVEATENQQSTAQFRFATAETDAQKIFEIQQSSYSNTAAPETPSGPAPGNQFEDKTCRAEAADTAGSGMSDQERSEDLNPGNAHCIHESVLIYEENSGLVKNDEEIRIHDDSFEGESCPSLNRTGAVDDSNLVESRMVDFESNGSKVDCPEIASPADVFSSANQGDHAGKTSSRIELEKVLETEEPFENMNSINYNMDAEGNRTPVAEDQIKGQLKDANATVADSVEEIIFKDLLNELGESIGLKRGSEVSLKKSEKLSATKCSDGEGITLTESSVKAEKQEYRAEIDVVAAITGTPNITEMKCSSSSDTATHETPFGPEPQSKDKLCSAGVTVSIAGSEICNQDVETSLVEDDKEILLQDDTIEGEIKNQPCLSLNKTGALDDALVEFASNANKVVCSGMTSLADVYSSANQTKFSGETSNELKPEKVLDLEESSRGENVNSRSDKIEVEDDTSPAQEDQSSMQLEDANITAAAPVQEVDFWDHLNKFCESCGTKEFEVSLKKAEETGTGDSSGIGMVQTESSVEINEMSEATGQKTIIARQWSLSGHDKDLISPLRPQVGSQDVQGSINRTETAVSNVGYGMSGQLKNEENVKIAENEHQETKRTEKELFFSGNKILYESSEGKFWADGVCDPLSDSQCAEDKKVDISDGSFNKVSGETQEKHICEVLDGEGTDPVSPEEKGICNEKLPFNGCLPVSNDMQEKSDAVCMDNKNMMNEIPANILPQLALEQLDNESEAAKQGAESGEVNARAFSNATQALPSEELTAPITPMQEKSEAVCMDNKNMMNETANILPQLALEQFDNEGEAAKQGAENGEVDARAFSNATQALPSEELIAPITSEPLSMRPLDHALVDGERNASGERVLDHPFIKDFAATIDSDGISASRETDVGQEDNIVDKMAISALNVELADYSGGKVDAELYGTNKSDTETIFQETDIFGVVSTEYPEEMSNTSASVGVENYGDLDDQGDEGGLQRDCSSSIGLDGLTSTVGIIVDNMSKVGTLESTLNNNDPQSGIKVDDPDVNDSHAAKQFDTAFTIEEAGVEDGEKTLVSHQRSLHGGKQEDVSSYADSKLEISIEKEHPQVMNDINDVGGTEISTDCKVTREERDGSFVERSKGDLEEIAEAKSDDCEGSMKTATAMDSIDSLVVNQPPCLDERESCGLETEEPHALHLAENIAGDSREVGSCSKLGIVSSMKPEMVVDCSSVSSICATSDEHKHLENPDESNILTNMEMSLFFGDEEEVKKPDAKAGDINGVALDKVITECNSSDIKEEDYVARSDVEDTNFSVKKDGPEALEETMELRKDFSGLDAAMADKSPLLKNSEVGRVVDGKEAFRTELNLLNVSAKKEGSNSVSVKQLISSIMKSKSKSGLIQGTPKRLILHDMKENEASTKREPIGNMTAPKTSSKRRPLERIGNY